MKRRSFFTRQVALAIPLLHYLNGCDISFRLSPTKKMVWMLINGTILPEIFYILESPMNLTGGESSYIAIVYYTTGWTFVQFKFV